MLGPLKRALELILFTWILKDCSDLLKSEPITEGFAFGKGKWIVKLNFLRGSLINNNLFKEIKLDDQTGT